MPSVSEVPGMVAAPLLLYDGTCGFCHGSVRFFLRHERSSRLRFAALDSPIGRAELVRHGIPPDFGRSVVLIENGQAYLYSTAVVRVAKYLALPWRLVSLGWWIPRPLRDAAYRLVARYRYLLAGKVEACELPDPSETERFVTGGRCD